MIRFKNCRTIFIVLVISVLCFGCANTARRAFEMDESQVQLRSMQTRAFDTVDKKMMVQTVISTMQDLDFVIEKADLMIGSVTGQKFLGYAIVKMTVTVRSRGEAQLLVRANAQYGIKSVEDAETYQDFFVALETALFLTAHQVD